MPDSASIPSSTPAVAAAFRRRLPIGAEPIDARTAHVRVWAPRASRVEVVTESGERTALDRDGDGYFAASFTASPGDRYRFKLDDDEKLYPDPASRFQPDGPHGPSEIVDPRTFRLDRSGVGGRRRSKARSSTRCTSARSRPRARGPRRPSELPELARIGVTMIEVMPVAEFDGRFGWGYDGVDLYAPTHLYGAPDDFRRFVDTAHGCGVAVILDVVYNHLGPVGNYLRAFSPAYFTDRYDNEWGDAINFDGPDAGAGPRVLHRPTPATGSRSFISTACASTRRSRSTIDPPEHIVTADRTARARGGGTPAHRHRRGERAAGHAAGAADRRRRLRPRRAVERRLPSQRDGGAHRASRGVLLRHARRAAGVHLGGEVRVSVPGPVLPLAAEPSRHAGVGPAAVGVRRLPAEPRSGGEFRPRAARRQADEPRPLARDDGAAAACRPARRCCFKGRSSRPRRRFCISPISSRSWPRPSARDAAEFLTQFPSVAELAHGNVLADPGDPKTFEQCKLEPRANARRTPPPTRCTSICCALRREDAAFCLQQPGGVDGAVLAPSAFALRFFTPDHWTTACSSSTSGPTSRRPSYAEPLLAPPPNADWMCRWSSEDPAYGGGGTPDLWPDGSWVIPSESALVLSPGPLRAKRPFPLVRRTA